MLRDDGKGHEVARSSFPQQLTMRGRMSGPGELCSGAVSPRCGEVVDVVKANC